MRVFSRYFFKVGSCSVEEMMENLDSFLFDEKLHYNKLDYYIRILSPEIDKNTRIWIAKELRCIPRKKDVVVFDVNDLLRDHPEFGCLEKVNPGVVITSLDSFGASKTVKATERDIRNIASQIPIPYFMDDVLFSYSGIDFFGHDRCEVNEPVKMIPWDLLNRKGSHISFSKSVFGSKAIDLCMMVEITAEDGVLCSDRFAQALSQKLDRKYEKETIVFLSQEEREYYAKLSELAKPVVEEICAFFKHSMERYPNDPNAGRFDAKYTKFILPEI